MAAASYYIVITSSNTYLKYFNSEVAMLVLQRKFLIL